MTAFDPHAPFALLWDEARGVARLFTGARRLIEGADTRAGLEALRAAVAAGDWVAGGFSYEAGLQLEPRLQGLERGPPFHWFGVFGAPQQLGRDELAALLAAWRAPVSIGAPRPQIAPEAWVAGVERAQQLIAAGDIYQANLTFPALVPLRGHPLALFARLFSPEAAPHGGLLHDGRGRWWLSLSPELFFRLEDGQLLGKPMKGTARRMPAPAADKAAADALAADPKNRAENLMITDLIRNDLGRVAVPGSVAVPHLQTIETYPSVHQMTSTVTARLQPGLDALDALEALFPCGSITGAPKIRAMEVIAELEPGARGIYCGSIGWIGPRGDAAHFNVAIRTLEIAPQTAEQTARLGLGAGIVADSVPADEWAECLLKAGFLATSRPAALIETMRIEAGGQIAHRRLHLARLAASAARFGIPLDVRALEAQLDCLRPETGRRLRLLLGATGHVALQLSPLPPVPETPVRVAIVPLPVGETDWRLFHKTSSRAFYDDARHASGAFECLFQRPDGLLTEGSFTSLFVERGGRLLTPPLGRGLLPGVLRASLVQSGMAEEADLTIDDLGQSFLIGNALRGLMPATL